MGLKTSQTENNRVLVKPAHRIFGPDSSGQTPARHWGVPRESLRGSGQCRVRPHAQHGQTATAAVEKLQNERNYYWTFLKLNIKILTYFKTSLRVFKTLNRGRNIINQN